MASCTPVLPRIRINLLLQFFLLGIAAFAVCSNVLKAPFIWDDEVMITGNALIRGQPDPVKIFTSGAFGEPLNDARFYRPLQILSYSADYRLWGLNPLGFRIDNLMLHFAGVLLLLLFLRETGISPIISFSAALIYAIHPMQVENITYLSGRGDVLCALFTFATLFFFMKLRSRYWPGWAVGALASLSLAFVSKENSIFLPMVLLFLACWKRETFSRHRTGTVVLLLAMFVTMTLFIWFRTTYTINPDSRPLSLISNAGTAARIYTFPSMLSTWVRFLFIPVHSHMEYHFVNARLWTADFLVMAGFLAGVVWILTRKILESRELLFYLAWFVLFLIPVSNLFFPLAATLREHWFCLSSVAVLLFTGRCLESICIRKCAGYLKTAAIILASAWIVFLGGSTYQRNKAWKDPFTLYSHDVMLAPQSFLLWNNLGVEYFRRHDLANAFRCFDKSKETSPPPGYAPTLNNLGVAYEYYKDFNMARTLYEKAIRLDTYKLAYQNLGRIMLATAEKEKTLTFLENAVRVFPDDLELIYYLGVACYLNHFNSRALAIMQEVERHQPGYKDTRAILQVLTRSGAF